MTRKRTPAIALLVGAVGVVFGDIGTSPLYVMKVVFGRDGLALPVNELTVHGIVSLIIWSLFTIVTVKYIGFVMKADNRGEGGIMALLSRVKSSRLLPWQQSLFIFIGLNGAALFYADTAVTPAISVLSAVEGVNIAAPALAAYIVPITLVMVAGLFWIQRFGTGRIGGIFGPVMTVWFLLLALGGILQIVQHPAILQAVSPLPALQFIVAMPGMAFVTMGAVFLAVTGAEALFADMGHFGRPPIARAWLFLVFPALVMCYMGQAALIINSPDAAANPLFLLYPEAFHLPLLILATIATLIASQAVIAGAFSLTRQAVQLGYLPRLTIRHTSDRQSGQIYVPFINLVLFAAVVVFIVGFGSSVQLASVYGVAISGALLVDTLLFAAIMQAKLQIRKAIPIIAVSLFFAIELVFLLSNSTKILHGAWAPMLLAISLVALLATWRRGEHIIRGERQVLEGTLQTFIKNLHAGKYGRIVRVPGKAVYIGHHPGHAPLALHATVRNLHELHQKVVIVYVQVSEVAHVPEAERVLLDDLAYKDGISTVTLTYGYHDHPNIPKTLKQLRHRSPELNFDPQTASYFISQNDIVLTGKRNLAPWRKALYILMERNALGATSYYRLPIERTTEMRVLLKL